MITVSVKLLLLCVVLLIGIFFIATFVWEKKRGNNGFVRIVRFLTAIVAMALRIGILTVTLLQGQSFLKEFILAYGWLIMVAMSGFGLRNNNQQNKK